MPVLVILAAGIIASATLVYTQHGMTSLGSSLGASMYLQMTTAHRDLLELGRVEIFQLIKEHGLNEAQFVQTLRCALQENEENCVPLGGEIARETRAPAWARNLTTDQAVFGLGDYYTRQVTGVSPYYAPNLWVDYKVSSEVYRVNRVIRFSIGNASVFGNTLTLERSTHALKNTVVFGNVSHSGSLAHLSPEASRVHGYFYFPSLFDRSSLSAQETLDWLADPTLPISEYTTDDLNTIPSDWFHGPSMTGPFTGSGWSENQISTRKIIENYSGRAMTWSRTQRRLKPPAFNPNASQYLATGSVTGGVISQFGYGQYSQGGVGTEELVLEENYFGNLILDGRDRPLEINGNLYVRGDVMIMGSFRGQGAIYSGRNIYVVGDLKAINYPMLSDPRVSLFGGSTQSHEILSRIAKPSTSTASRSEARIVADQIWDADRLALIATNHLIIGDPFTTVIPTPDDQTLYVSSHRRAIVQGFSDYDKGPHQQALAIDKKNGFSMNTIDKGNGSNCHLLPWENDINCLTLSSSDYVNRVLRTPNVQYSQPDQVDSDQAYYYDQIGRSGSPFQRAQILPGNHTSDEFVSWIDRPTYGGITFKAVEIAKAIAPENIVSDRRRGRSKNIDFWITGEEPYDTTNWDIDSFLIKLDEISGIPSELEALPVIVSSQLNGITNARIALNRFLEMCKSASRLEAFDDPALPDGSVRDDYRDDLNTAHRFSDFAGAKPFLGRNKDNYTEINTNNPSLKKNGIDVTSPDGQNYRIAEIRCTFSYDYDHSNRPTGEIQFKGVLPSTKEKENLVYQNGVYYCSDTHAEPTSTPDPPINGIDRTHRVRCHGPGHIAEANAAGTPPTSTYDPRFTYDDDFWIEVTFSVDHHPKVQIQSRYWDPFKLRATRRVKQIDAFLFANQFIVRLSDSDSDQQLRVNGGIVARDLIGSFRNEIGNERTHSIPNTINAPNIGTPGLIIKLDPRFQFLQSIPNEQLAKRYRLEK